MRFRLASSSGIRSSFSKLSRPVMHTPSPPAPAATCAVCFHAGEETIARVDPEPFIPRKHRDAASTCFRVSFVFVRLTHPLSPGRVKCTRNNKKQIHAQTTRRISSEVDGLHGGGSQRLVMYVRFLV